MNIYRQYKPYGVAVVGVDLYNGTAALVQTRFVNPTGVTFPILTRGADLGLLYGASTDDFFVIDASGKVVFISRFLQIAALQQAIGSVTSVMGGSPGAVPDRFELKQNHPNPFNPETFIEYELRSGTTQRVELAVFDIIGKRVRTLVQEPQPSGFYRVRWDGTDMGGRKVAAGPYFYRLMTADRSETRKMVLMQ